MGKDGVAYLFVCPDQGDPLTAIENLVNRVIPPLEIKGFSQARKRVEPVAREIFNNSVSRSHSSMATR
jgi:ATP-dependent RNA helicase DeaD